MLSAFRWLERRRRLELYRVEVKPRVIGSRPNRAQQYSVGDFVFRREARDDTRVPEIIDPVSGGKRKKKETELGRRVRVSWAGLQGR
jgi:hypothetical protein